VTVRTTDERTALEQIRDDSGYDVAGVFAFGDSEQMADNLLGCVRRGPKRATAGLVADFESDGEPLPAVGSYWGVLDGRGVPQVVIETTDVRVGPVASVDHAFAWDEGENDRTRAGWLDAHRSFFRRRGCDDPDAAPCVFERFRVVWPEPDDTAWLADGVRELRVDERAWMVETLSRRWGGTDMVSRGVLLDAADMPALIAERDGMAVGLLTFLPRPGGHTEIVTIDAFPAGAGTGGLLLDAVAELGRHNGWRRLWLVTTNDNTPALRSHQRHGFDMIALHHGAIAVSRTLKPQIPLIGIDGIPVEHEIELELVLGS
jgi:uncharacterized protein YhfF